MKLAAFALAAFAVATVWLGAVHARAAVATPTLQKITIDARGPLAMVEVTRTVVPEPAEGGGGSEALLDLALPEASALVSVEVRDGARWRAIDPATVGSAHAAETYRAESAARGVTPASEPFDESTTHRLRLLRSAGHGGGSTTSPFVVRYRFSALPEAANGRLRIRFPAATDRSPPPAEVALRLGGAADADIAGVRVPFAAGTDTAAGRASTRGAWEACWTPRDPATPAAPQVEARLALAPVGPQQTALPSRRAGVRVRRAGRPAASCSSSIARAALGCRGSRPNAIWSAPSSRRCRPARGSTPSSSRAAPRASFR